MPATRTLASGSDDPDVKIPAAVKRHSLRADEIHRQAYNTETLEPPVEPTVEPKPADVAPVAPAPAPAPAPTVDWEHRYNSMKGRFDRSQDSIRDMQQQLAELKSAQQVTPKGNPPVPTELDPASFQITAKEVEDYGEEFLSVVGKKAKAELNPELSSIKEELNGLKAKLGTVDTRVQASSKVSMQEYLDNKVPTWEAVNIDQEFLDWLGLPDAYSGAIRHDLLGAAFERQDAPRVAAFFQGFLSERAATSVPAEDPRPDPAPAPQNAGKVPLEVFAAPGRAKTAAPAPVPTEKPFITRAQIARFYSDCAAGRYRGKDEEKGRLERMIFDAEREGRIQ